MTKHAHEIEEKEGELVDIDTDIIKWLETLVVIMNHISMLFCVKRCSKIWRVNN